MSLGWPAPAKLNLFLHITGRRADGYHLLQTLFQFVDYGDTLTFTPRHDGVIRHLNPLPGVDVEKDLVVRAARALQQQSGSHFGVDIGIDKRLPMGGGLGGGSSDAATTLVALNRLWGSHWRNTELATLGLSLGADVPIFIHGEAAWAEGVGEQLTPVAPPEPWYLVIDPRVHIDTATIFQSAELTRTCSPITIRAFLEGAGGNVFEPVVRRRYPEVAHAIDWLTQFAPTRLTGTGGCLFAHFEDRASAELVVAQLPDRWRGFVTQGRNRSPLLERLEQEP